MKGTKLPSRKRRALRRVLFALVLLFLVNHILWIGLLFPIQAIRQNEERAGTGRTAVVFRDWAPEIHWSQLMYLTENENVTMLSGTRLTPFGWTGSSGVTLDCTEPAPIHGGTWFLNWGKVPMICVFGRVDAPDVDLLTVQIWYEDWSGGESVRRNAFSWGCEREDLLEKDGGYYFLMKNYPVDFGEYTSSLSTTVTGIDRAGYIIAQVELEQGASSYFG